MLHWGVSTASRCIIHVVPGELQKYTPSFRYVLIDERRYSKSMLPGRNIVSAIFKLEQSISIEDIRRAVDELLEWLDEPEQAGLSRAFTTWINRVLLPIRSPGEDFSKVTDLMEVRTMLAERVKLIFNSCRYSHLTNSFL